MATKEKILGWTLEYACRYKYHNVISVISKKTSTNIEDLAIPKIYLVTSALHSILSNEELDSYNQALDYVFYLYENCKDIIPFRIFSKLSTGIKMVMLMKMLEENKEGILEKLNEFFPRKGPEYADADQKELQRLSSVYSNFRKFYLPLVASSSLRRDYLQDEYKEEYGPEFHSAIRKLTNNFLSKIENHFPLTVLEKFMKCSEDQCYELHEDSPSASFEIFLDIVLGKNHLTDADLLQLLTMLGIITECKRVQPLDLIGLYTSSERSKSESVYGGSDPLFSSYSNSDKTCIDVLSGKSDENCDNNHDILVKNTGEKMTADNISPYGNVKYLSKDINRSNIHKKQIPNTLTRICGNKNCDMAGCVHSMDLSRSSCAYCLQKELTTEQSRDNLPETRSKPLGEIKSSVQKPKQCRRSLRLRSKSAELKSADVSCLGQEQTKTIETEIDPIMEKCIYVAEKLEQVDSELDTSSCYKFTQTSAGNQADGVISNSIQAWEDLRHQSEESRPDQVYCITSSSENQSAKSGTCIEIGSSPEIEIFTGDELTNNCSSEEDIFSCESDVSSYNDNVDDFVPTSDLDEIDLDDIYNFHLKRLSPKSKVLTVPELHRHVIHLDCKLCVVKLFRNKEKARL